MQARYTLTPEAEADLTSLLSENPGVGHVREDLTDKPVNFWVVHSYLIVFRPETRPLQIVRVLSGYRDIVEQLKV